MEDGPKGHPGVGLSLSATCYLEGMQITVELPGDIAKHTNPGREALEALVLEAYKSRNLTQFQAGQLLGLFPDPSREFSRAPPRPLRLLDRGA